MNDSFKVPTINFEFIFSTIFNGGRNFLESFSNFLLSGWALGLWIIWMFLGLLFLGFFVYIWLKLSNLRKEEKEELTQAIEVISQQEPIHNKDWERIMKYMDSDNPSDWKLAILEADVLLDDLVTRMGYKGDNLGEKLKSVERSDFLTLDDAWEAHKTRNKIAHEGQMSLSSREARHTLDLFKKVFDEFPSV